MLNLPKLLQLLFTGRLFWKSQTTDHVQAFQGENIIFQTQQQQATGKQ